MESTNIGSYIKWIWPKGHIDFHWRFFGNTASYVWYLLWFVSIWKSHKKQLWVQNYNQHKSLEFGLSNIWELKVLVHIKVNWSHDFQYCKRAEGTQLFSVQAAFGMNRFQYDFSAILHSVCDIYFGLSVFEDVIKNSFETKIILCDAQNKNSEFGSYKVWNPKVFVHIKVNWSHDLQYYQSSWIFNKTAARGKTEHGLFEVKIWGIQRANQGTFRSPPYFVCRYIFNFFDQKYWRENWLS